MTTPKKELKQNNLTPSYAASPGSARLFTDLDRDFIPFDFRETGSYEMEQAARVSLVSEFFTDIVNFYNEYCAHIKHLPEKEREKEILKRWPGRIEGEIALIFPDIITNPHRYIFEAMEGTIWYMYLAYIEGADINCHDHQGNTAVIRMADRLLPRDHPKKSQNMAIARHLEFLILANADIFASTNNKGLTALDIAVSEDAEASVITIIKQLSAGKILQEICKNLCSDYQHGKTAPVSQGEGLRSSPLTIPHGFAPAASGGVTVKIAKGVKPDLEKQAYVTMNYVLGKLTLEGKEDAINRLSALELSQLIILAAGQFNQSNHTDASDADLPLFFQAINDTLYQKKQENADIIFAALQADPRFVIKKTYTSTGPGPSSTDYYSLSILRKKDLKKSPRSSEKDERVTTHLTAAPSKNELETPKDFQVRKSTARIGVHPTQGSSSSSSSSLDHTDAVVLGDLHASGLKLIYFLLAEDRAFLPEERYNRLVVLHEKARKANDDEFSQFFLGATGEAEKFTKADFDEFTAITREVTAISNEGRVILIGDEKLDRAGSDDLNLLVDEMLTKWEQPIRSTTESAYLSPIESKLDKTTDNAKVEILLSNHGYGFLKLLKILLNSDESSSLESVLNEFDKTLREHPPMSVPDKQFISIFGLRNALKNGFITLERLRHICKNIYFKRLKPLSYSLSKNADQIFIYSHGMIDHFIILGISRMLDVDFNADSPLALAGTIERINLAFQKKLQAGELETLMEEPDSPFYTLTWNYSLKELPSKKKILYKDQHGKPHSPDLPFPVCYIHGHCGDHEPLMRDDRQTKNGPGRVYYNLDTPFGIRAVHTDYVRAISHGRLLSQEERSNPELMAAGKLQYILQKETSATLDCLDLLPDPDAPLSPSFFSADNPGSKSAPDTSSLSAQPSAADTSSTSSSTLGSQDATTATAIQSEGSPSSSPTSSSSTTGAASTTALKKRKRKKGDEPEAGMEPGPKAKTGPQQDNQDRSFSETLAGSVLGIPGCFFIPPPLQKQDSATTGNKTTPQAPVTKPF